MSAAGPELPPHLLAKRKRQAEDAPDTDDTSSPGAKRPRSPASEDKRQRVLGPAPPPAPLHERPAEPAQAEDEDDRASSSSGSDDDDDDFGPALPSAAADHHHRDDDSASHARPTAPAPARSQRDEWMMVPPTQDDLAARMDPSKVRARGFNTGKAARPAAAAAGAGGMDTAWTETPEQKLKRLQDEAMGVDSKAGPGSAGFDARAYEKTREKEERARRIREHTEKTRGASLLDRHQDTKPEEKEDDPSKRAFDREKDMGHGGRMGHAQRKEMLSKAANFSSKFAGGSYL